MDTQREALAKTLSEMRSSGFEYLKFITAVDYPEQIKVIYMLANLKANKSEQIEVVLEKKDGLWIDTCTKIFPAADWYERELSEMFGIEIKGRNAKRLLLENWNGAVYPLRKEFQWGKEYKKV